MCSVTWLRILIPMVAGLDEARQARKLLDKARAEIPAKTVTGDV